MYSIFKKDLINIANKVLEEHVKFENGAYTSADIQRLQLDRFYSVLKYVRSNSPFYKHHFSSLDTLSRTQLNKETISAIPFTTKNDLRQSRQDVFSMPLDKAWIYYETTGTTGAPTPCPRSELDSIVNNTPLVLRYREILSAHGDNHIVAVMGPTELHATGDTFEDVWRSLNYTMVKMWPRSPLVGQKRALNIFKELGITALVCTPAVASELARTAKKNGFDIKQLGVRVMFLLGELITPGRLKSIGSVWGATAYNCMYASQEASILAVCTKNNQLSTVPINNYYELIDPVTETCIPVEASGNEGELVITNLYLGQKPLIRYRTGDMVRARIAPDGSWTIEPIGRVKDKLYLNERKYSAYDLESIIFDNIENCLEYSVIVDHDGNEDCLTIILEVSNEEQNNTISTSHLAQEIYENLGVKAQVVIGKPDSVSGTAAMVSWKAARLHDRRLLTEDSERVYAKAIANLRSEES